MKNNAKVQPPLRYPGSKFRAYKFIESFVLSVDHDEFREPFFGSGAVFFQKEKCEFVWLNDLDDELMNFYKIIQDKNSASKLASIVEKVKPSKEQFNLLRDSKPNNPFDKACRYFVLNRTAYSGIMHLPNWGFHKIKSVQPNKWPTRIIQASNKLQNVKLTSLDYETVLFAPAQGKSVLIFLDPPYFAADQKRAYEKSFEYEDHVRLANNLKQIKFKFILTYDDCPEVRKLYEWANIYNIEFMYNTANSNVTTRKKGKELIITNFEVKKEGTFY